LSYAPIPLGVALQQYNVPNGFAQRFYNFFHPGAQLRRNGHDSYPAGNHLGEPSRRPGFWTLPKRVFTRGRFQHGKSYTWTHVVSVGHHSHTTRLIIPASEHTQRFTDAGGSPLKK
jgi:hypothetical protein